MAKGRSPWPFAPTDGGPQSRPLVVDLDNVLIATLTDLAGAERALRASGFTDERLRTYTSEQIVAYDEEFRSGRGLLDRAVGTVVDNHVAMAEYVDDARRGGSAVWVRVDDLHDGNRVVRQLADHDVLHVWFYDHERVISLKVG